ncbi:MAG: glycosyltransferase [Weeksellaceae bacterium]|nr:glycosyltransferase [Weeksellaceae bacterium]
MRLIVNASTLSGSGVTQVAVSFIEECKAFLENTYLVLVSKVVVEQLTISEFPDNFQFHVVAHHPLSGLKGGVELRKIKKLQRRFRPDVMFSVFGPSWWKPYCPHLVGYAYPHYVYPESPLFLKLSLKEKIAIWLKKKIHISALNREASFFVSETDDVSNRLKKLLPDVKNRFYTVGNTYSSLFHAFMCNPDQSTENLLPERSENEFRFLSLCTFHMHKNLLILNKVIPILNRDRGGINIKFILTIDDAIFESKFSAEAKKSIINIGRQPVHNCPRLYMESDSLFLPTLLECFSANYPEAMYMKRPIVTSNLTFATSVCGNAALYFDPTHAKDISEKILMIYHDEKLRDELVINGSQQLTKFPDASERARKYLAICKTIAKKYK